MINRLTLFVRHHGTSDIVHAGVHRHGNEWYDHFHCNYYIWPASPKIKGQIVLIWTFTTKNYKLNEIFFLDATLFQFQFHFLSSFAMRLINSWWENHNGHSIQDHCSLPISLSVQLYIKCFIKQPGKRKWIYLEDTYPAPPKTSVAPDISRSKTVMTWLKEKKATLNIFFKSWNDYSSIKSFHKQVSLLSQT